MTSTRDWMNEPRQDRSQATNDRILAAAAEALAESTLADIPVADLARRAGVSVGGFYARFKSKDALLHALDEHTLVEMVREVRRAMDAGSLGGAAVGEVVARYVRTMVRFFTRHRSLVRQIVIKARTSEDPAFLARMREANAVAHGLLKARLLERRGALRCAEPEAAIEFAIMMVSAAARESVLFGDRRMNLSTARGRELVVALVRAFLAYLGVEGALTWTP